MEPLEVQPGTVTPEALLGVRRDWRAGRVESREGRRGLGELSIAAGLIALALAVHHAVDATLPDWVRLVLDGFCLVGALIGATGLWRLLRRVRFGAPSVRLAGAPLERGRVAAAELAIPRRVRFRGPVAFRVSAVRVDRRVDSDGEETRVEEVLWQEVRYVGTDRVRLEPEETRVPFRLLLAPGFPDTDLARSGMRHFWRLEVLGRAFGPDLHAEFELPVLGEAPEAELATQDPFADGAAPAREVLRLAGFRLSESPRSLIAEQPLVPSPSIAVAVLVANGFLLGLARILQLAGAPLLIPGLFVLAAVVTTFLFRGSLIGRARLRVAGGEVTVRRGVPGFGLAGTLDREAFDRLHVVRGGHTSRVHLYRLEAAPETGQLAGRTIVGSLPDRTTAQALLVELRAALDRAG